MAANNHGPFVDVRSVITLARREGERLAGLGRDVQALVFKRPAELAAEQLAKASTAVLRRFSAATQDEIDALTNRIALLEKRLKTIERRKRKARRSAE